MVPSIARQSVIIKCNMQKSVLTGNYEYYYAAGLAERLSGVKIPEGLTPSELEAFLAERLPGFTPSDEREKYLYEMMAEYRPGDEYDAQMQELFAWGRGEEHLWSVTLPEK